MSEIMENVVVPSNTPSALEGRQAPAPWQGALLAGLPHALMALTVQAVTVAAAYGLIPSVSEGGQPIQIAGVGVFALGLIAALVIAWRRQMFNVVGWTLAAGAGLFIGSSGYPRLFWALWVIWLYVGLAAAVLAVELLALRSPGM